MAEALQEPAPILRVSVGAPVYTRDEQKIGTVKDIRGQAFQVEPGGLFKRSYWLPGDTVEMAVPEEAVILSASQDQLDDLKIDEPLAA